MLRRVGGSAGAARVSGGTSAGDADAGGGEGCFGGLEVSGSATASARLAGLAADVGGDPLLRSDSAAQR